MSDLLKDVFVPRCSLGDVTNDDACYEKALEVSNNRSARAKVILIVYSSQAQDVFYVNFLSQLSLLFCSDLLLAVHTIGVTMRCLKPFGILLHNIFLFLLFILPSFNHCHFLVGPVVHEICFLQKH